MIKIQILIYFLKEEIKLNLRRIKKLYIFFKTFSIFRLLLYLFNNSFVPTRDKIFRNYILKNSKKWKNKNDLKSWKNKKSYKLRLNRTLLNRWGSSQDLVGTIIFLSSDASRYITGQDIYVDGGWLAKGI